MAIAAAARGVSKGIQSILKEREMARQQKMLEAARQRAFGMDEARLGLAGAQEARLARGQRSDEAYRQAQLERQGRQDELADTERRSKKNVEGQYQMLADLIPIEGGITPKVRQFATETLTRIGKPPDELFREPPAPEGPTPGSFEDYMAADPGRRQEIEGARSRYMAAGREPDTPEGDNPKLPQGIQSYIMDMKQRGYDAERAEDEIASIWPKLTQTHPQLDALEVKNAIIKLFASPEDQPLRIDLGSALGDALGEP